MRTYTYYFKSFVCKTLMYTLKFVYKQTPLEWKYYFQSSLRSENKIIAIFAKISESHKVTVVTIILNKVKLFWYAFVIIICRTFQSFNFEPFFKGKDNKKKWSYFYFLIYLWRLRLKTVSCLFQNYTLETGYY